MLVRWVAFPTPDRPSTHGLTTLLDFHVTPVCACLRFWTAVETPISRQQTTEELPVVLAKPSTWSLADLVHSRLIIIPVGASVHGMSGTQQHVAGCHHVRRGPCVGCILKEGLGNCSVYNYTTPYGHSDNPSGL